MIRHSLRCSVLVQPVASRHHEDTVKHSVASPRLRLGPPATSWRPHPLWILKMMPAAHDNAIYPTKKVPEMIVDSAQILTKKQG
jgi:hypothetical protein